MKIGYLIPEFPGQTHIWMWREILHMREWGNQIQIFSTRRPSENVQARHAFAESAIQETFYIWPQSISRLVIGALWAIFTRPIGLTKVICLGLTLDVNERPRWRSTLPLVLIACILAQETLNKKIAHLHSHSCANSAILAMMLKRLTGIPYSLTLNANIDWWGGAMFEKLSEAEFTCTHAKWIFDQIVKDYPTLRKNQAIMGGVGVDTLKWKPVPVKASLTLENQGFQIISVGRLHPSKGHDLLLRSVKRLINDGQVVNLKIIGAGPEKEALQSHVKNLGIVDFVEFTGSLSEDLIIEYMKQTDLFVLASHAEPLGVVYMEAMAMEVATIGTNNGGVPEIITDGEDGLLVPPGDEIALTEAIKLVIENPELRHRLGYNGRRKIIDRFDSRIGAAILHQRIRGTFSSDYQLPMITDQTIN